MPVSNVLRAVYVHIPFCRAKCAYCDFNSYAGKDGLHEAYVGALCQEADNERLHWWRHAHHPVGRSAWADSIGQRAGQAQGRGV